jgi:hypothetical protein
MDETVFDLGAIVTGSRHKFTVQIENVGDEPLLLDGVESCCNVHAELRGKVVAPGQFMPLDIEVYPFKFMGELRSEVVVRNNDPRHPRYPVLVKAQVVPAEHALAEIPERVADLGVVNPDQLAPFRVRLRNSGNATLVITGITTSPMVRDGGSRPLVFPGEEHELSFFFRPEQGGPIEERITITTNDARGHVVTVLVKGYVSRQRVPEQALSIWPLGGRATYDAGKWAYELPFTIRNGSGREISVLATEIHPATGRVDLNDRLPPGATPGLISITQQEGLPREGYILLNIAIPFEIH